MLNMGWTIDKDKKETIKVQGKGSGLWFTRKKDTIVTPVESRENSQEGSSSKPVPTRSNSKWFTTKSVVEEPEEEIVSPAVSAATRPTPPRRRPSRAATMSSGFWPRRVESKDDKDLPERPPHQKVKSDTAVVLVKPKDHSPTRSHTENEVVATTQAPAWLLNACNALEFITSEHPKAMSIISAILITAGSIPAIPAIAAGAGGAILASGTAHAIGAVAVGVGQALSASVKNQQKKQEDGHGTAPGSGHGH
ncbi:hypothetical protein D9613_003648 [Agrocybe pediades]|uniref:Uncharacterized protein n=1 Tax=Agrocybe pediades TaxID=84607 RepID=A0A8H4QIR2_9AGAR|nr:hypothetical protein D9613_003648 [Agrocybe pediades]